MGHVVGAGPAWPEKIGSSVYHLFPFWLNSLRFLPEAVLEGGDHVVKALAGPVQEDAAARRAHLQEAVDLRAPVLAHQGAEGGLTMSSSPPVDNVKC